MAARGGWCVSRLLQARIRWRGAHVEPEADRRLSPDLRLPRVVQSWPETPKIQARVAELQGVGGFYFAGAHAVPGMGLLEQACQAGEAAAARVLADLAA